MSDTGETTRVADGAERAQVRGGTLLLVGRTIAVGVNFATQVLIVRSLSKTDYGAFAYGLSVANLGETLITLGLDRGITRFVPIFQERGEHKKAAGTIALVVGTVAVLSVVLVLVVVGLGNTFAGSVDDADEGRDLLVILVLLAPIQALDNLLVGIFAVYGRAGAIFLRRFVLGPVLRLVVVVLVVAGDRSPLFLAVGYVVAGGVGVALYLGVVGRLLRRNRVFHNLRGGRAQLPWREVLAFTFPLLSGDLVFVLIDSVGAIVLGQVGDAADVASLRAVLPVARLNQLALASFGVLFTPLAARRFARDDGAGVARLYWQTAAFVAVITFPIFALTFSLSGPITVALFGDRYEGSAVILASLALGYYTSSALGFNGLTLNVFGRVKTVLAVNLTAAVLSLLATAVLVPLYGAVGAGLAAGATLVVHNVLRQIGMSRTTAVPAFARSVRPVYAAVALAAGALLLMQQTIRPPLLVGVLGAVVATIFVSLVARPNLALGEMFPAVRNRRALRWLAVDGAGADGEAGSERSGRR